MERNYARTVSQVAVSQGAAGASDLVAIPGAGLFIYVVSYCIVLDATGTIKFTEGNGPSDLSGAMPFAINGGALSDGDGINPILSTVTANSKLSILTVTGKAFGYLRYFVAPA